MQLDGIKKKFMHLKLRYQMVKSCWPCLRLRVF